MSLLRKMLSRTRTRLSSSMCGIAGLQVLLDQVFDRPVDSGPSLYQLSSGQPILDPGPHADVALEVWWTHGHPVDDDAIIDETVWYEWLSHRDELEHRRALFLTDVRIHPDLQAQFGVRRNVLAVRRGHVSYVLGSYADDPSIGERVARLETAAEHLAG